MGIFHCYVSLPEGKSFIPLLQEMMIPMNSTIIFFPIGWLNMVDKKHQLLRRPFFLASNQSGVPTLE